MTEGQVLRHQIARLRLVPKMKQHQNEHEEPYVRLYLNEAEALTNLCDAMSRMLDAHGTPLMAISTVGFAAQFNERQITALANDVRDRAQRITRAISGGAPRTAQ